ncbi:protein PLASTID TRANSCRIPTIONALLY ACTIVE 7 [Citrus sinensis]|uniref:Protein PLASTID TRANSCRIPTIONALLY ACTIVE 7 n=1 Tax=Citrus sinensis TaxID=2711 RepID=A0ACB8M3F0_CITSI|nr:protein PLASTID TRANSCRIPTIONALLY ACTIVE 7 [Citrus sinensis]
MATSTSAFISLSTLPRIDSGAGVFRGLNLKSNCFQITSQLRNDGRGRRVWRRRKLSKKDDMLRYSVERIPFLEEQERKIKEGGKLLTMDIERLLLSEDNRYDFVNEIAAEATAYVKRNRNEYGGKKKAILHALSNRVNDLGFYRPDAYEETDPFKPGPTCIREEFT